MAVIRIVLQNSIVLGTITPRRLKIDPYSLRQKCSPKNLVFDNDLMVILLDSAEKRVL